MNYEVQQILEKRGLKSKESLIYKKISSLPMPSMKEEIILGIAEKVRATKTEINEAEEKYDALATILKKAPRENVIHHVRFQISPQGSQAFRVAIKEPLGNKQCDLDAIITYFDLDRRQITLSPFLLVQSTYKAISPHLRQYGLRAELKDRCVSINYKNITTDILPAIPFDSLNSQNKKILIPERRHPDGYQLVSSDPIGLLSRFNARANLEVRHLEGIRMDDGSVAIDDFPEHLEYLGVMRYIIILIKRARDQFFLPDVKLGRKAVKSILLTTFLSEKYSGEKELLSTLFHLVNKLNQWSHLDLSFIQLPNPVNIDEDFAQYLRDNPLKLKKIRLFTSFLEKKIRELLTYNSIDLYVESLIDLFGHDMVISEVRKIEDRHKKHQFQGKHTINTVGILGTNESMAVSKTHFYGDI